VAGEDVEDELRAVEYAAGQCGLEVAKLRWRQIVIEENEIGFGGGSDAGDLFDFSGANQRRRIRLWAALQNLGDDLAAGAQEQFAKFGERFVGVEAGEIARTIGRDLRAGWIGGWGEVGAWLGGNRVIGTQDRRTIADDARADTGCANAEVHTDKDGAFCLTT